VAQQPTFQICTGATKAGTSWLYRYFLGHPDCHLRAIKERHFFNSADAGMMRCRPRREKMRLLRARAHSALRPQFEYVARLMPDLPASWRKNMTEVHG
jgi:hypothetical protein